MTNREAALQAELAQARRELELADSAYEKELRRIYSIIPEALRDSSVGGISACLEDAVRGLVRELETARADGARLRHIAEEATELWFGGGRVEVETVEQLRATIDAVRRKDGGA
jgi:hypothetical protein